MLEAEGVEDTEGDVEGGVQAVEAYEVAPGGADAACGADATEQQYAPGRAPHRGDGEQSVLEPGGGVSALGVALLLLPASLLAVASVAISPKTRRKTEEGVTRNAGRFRVWPKMRLNSWLVTGLGATRLNGPLASSRSMRKRIAATSSAI